MVLADFFQKAVHAGDNAQAMLHAGMRMIALAGLAQDFELDIVIELGHYAGTY